MADEDLRKKVTDLIQSAEDCYLLERGIEYFSEQKGTDEESSSVKEKDILYRHDDRTGVEMIRTELLHFIQKANEEQLTDMLILMAEPEGGVREDWWNDKEFVKELDSRLAALESGEDKGISHEELMKKMKKMLSKRYI